MRARLIDRAVGVVVGVTLCASLARDDSLVAPTVLPRIVLPAARFTRFEELVDPEDRRVEVLRLELCGQADQCTTAGLPAPGRDRRRLEF